MNKQQASWLIVRAFGVYLLLQAFMLGVRVLGQVIAYIGLASSPAAEHDYVTTVLRSYRSSMSASVIPFVVLSAAGIYFLRGGRFLIRWLQYTPHSRTDADALTISTTLTAQEARNMSVKERLAAAGLFHEFADAADRRDIPELERILRQIHLTPEDIQTVIAQMLPTSA
jgi:hypothetical protein